VIVLINRSHRNMLFEDVAQLLDKLESGYRIFQETVGQAKKKENKKTLFYAALRTFRDNYLNSGHSLLPCYLYFSLLCPGEDIERKYGLKSLSLSKLLIKVYGKSRRVEALKEVDEDIGLIVAEILSATNSSSSLDTVEEINSLLDQLASTSKFSSKRVRAIKSLYGSQRDIIAKLFLRQSGVAAKWLVRV
jgi:hypothetical protein